MKQAKLFATVIFLVSGCSDASAPNAQPNIEQLKGWGPYQFGMAFDDAVGAQPGIEWNSVALRECINEISIKGCFLPSSEEDSYMPLIEGIKYNPDLTFTKTGKLQSVSLGYSKEGDISQSQCLNVFERSVDWVAKEHGKLATPNYDPSSETPGWEHKRNKTSADNIYQIGIDTEDGSYVTTPIWSHRPKHISTNWRKQKLEWQSVSHITIFSAFVYVDEKPYCHVTIGFDAAKSDDDYNH